MKKLYTLALLALTMLPSTAQVVLMDPEGTTEYTDGQTLTITPTEVDEIYIFHSPKICNKSAKSVKVTVSYDVTFPKGNFMDCISGSCLSRTTSGNYTTSEFTLAAGEVKDTQTEWNFSYWDDDEGEFAYYEGTCTSVFTIFVDGVKGNTITVNYVNNLSAGINDITVQNNAASRAAFDLQGRRIATTHVKGLFVKGGKKFIR